MLIDAHSDYWPKGAIVLLVIRLVAWEATTERAKRRGEVLVFRGALAHRAVLGIGSSIAAWSMVSGWQNEEPWVLAILGVFAALGAFAWPSTVSLSSAGVEQWRWWTSKTLIPWSEVTSIQSNRSGDCRVCGSSGKWIALSRYHVDRVLFEGEVRHRAHLEKTLDASAPLTLGLHSYPPIPVGLQGRHKSTRRERKEEQSGE